MLKKRVEKFLSEDGRPHVYAVYGVLYHRADEIENGSFTAIFNAINHCFKENKFYKVESSDEDVLVHACNILNLDPELIRLLWVIE